MNYTKKILALLLAVAMTLSLATMLVGCNSEQGDSTTGGTTPSGDGPAGTKSYMVNVQTVGGMALPQLDVYLYADNTLAVFFVATAELSGNGVFRDDNIVAVENNERLIAYKGFTAEDCVSKTLCFFLTDKADVCKVCAGFYIFIKL